jgi:hypothetical protein
VEDIVEKRKRLSGGEVVTRGVRLTARTGITRYARAFFFEDACVLHHTHGPS